MLEVIFCIAIIDLQLLSLNMFNNVWFHSVVKLFRARLAFNSETNSSVKSTFIGGLYRESRILLISSSFLNTKKISSTSNTVSSRSSRQFWKAEISLPQMFLGQRVVFNLAASLMLFEWKFLAWAISFLKSSSPFGSVISCQVNFV